MNHHSRFIAPSFHNHSIAIFLLILNCCIKILGSGIGRSSSSIGSSSESLSYAEKKKLEVKKKA